MLIVLDTNVLVSGLLNEYGNPGKLLDLILANVITVAYDDRIINEYEKVLARPELHIETRLIQTVITAIELNGLPVEPAQAPERLIDDPGDVPFIETGLSCPGLDAIVTGNMRHFRKLQQTGLVKVLTPTEFLDNFFSK